MRKAALELVTAVRAGEAQTQCRVLTEQARRDQGCGNAGLDIGPFLNLAVESVKNPTRDVKIVAIDPDDAKVALPDWRLKRFGPPPKRPVPVILELKRLDSGEWKIAEFSGSANLP